MGRGGPAPRPRGAAALRLREHGWGGWRRATSEKCESEYQASVRAAAFLEQREAKRAVRKLALETLEPAHQRQLLELLSAIY